MTKMKKIIIGIVCTVAALFLMFVLSILWLIFGDSIKIKVQTALKTPAAKAAARDYIEEKYGDTPKILEVKPITRAKGVIFATGRYFAGIELTADNYTVMVYFNENEPVIVDNRQYDEICSAVKEHFFDDKALGYSYEINNFSLNFYRKLENGIHDQTGDTKFTSVYFDGDIEKFLHEANAEISVSVTYEGYPEKRGEYRTILNNKLEYLYPLFGEEGSSVYLFIHDPNVDLPEIKNKYENSSRIYRIPRYEKYMELIACGMTANKLYSYAYSSSENEHITMQTEFYRIDEYTYISNAAYPIRSDSDFNFMPAYFSDNTTAYRGRIKTGDLAEEKILRIRGEGRLLSLNEHRGSDILLRLDRNYYNITDKTVPLRIYDGLGTEQGKRFYTSVGYGDYDSEDCDWYYLDEKYLYLYISGLSETYLTFSDL